MAYFLFLLNKLPGVAFSKDGVTGFDVTGVKVGLTAGRACTARLGCTKVLLGGLWVLHAAVLWSLVQQAQQQLTQCLCSGRWLVET